MSLPQEIFDVVDIDGKKIGNASRGEVHRQGLYHRSVHVLLGRRPHEILLQKRAATKDICPNAWDLSCGEHLKPGETYEAAAYRGIFEELGVRVPLIRLRSQHLQKNDYAHAKDYELVELWWGILDVDVIPDLDEVAEVQWRSLDEILQLPQNTLTPWFIDELAWIEHGGKLPF